MDYEEDKVALKTPWLYVENYTKIMALLTVLVV